MSSGDVLENSTLLSMTALKQAITAVAPEALLVDPRIIRRVIKYDRRLKGLGFRVPHYKTYTIERARLLAYVDHRELDPEADLAPIAILLSRPTEQDVEEWGSSELLMRYWRLLFHARVHLEMESRYPTAEERRAIADKRRRQLGEPEFAEIRTVLLQDGFLFREQTDWDVYTEFSAVALDIKYFTTDELPLCFPAIENWKEVVGILSLDVRHAELYLATRLLPPGHERLEAENAMPRHPKPKFGRKGRGRSADSPGKADKWREKAMRSARLGNHIKAAMQWRLAANLTSGKKASLLRESALKELEILIEKLRRALGQDEDSTAQWLAGLSPVLDSAISSFWSAEARLLYDLQKICVEDESESQRGNLLRWLTSLGREPWTRPLPLLKHVLLAKYIRSAQRRLAKTRLGDNDRKRVTELLTQADEIAEQQLRNTIRPLIDQQLDHVGLIPENVPERVARIKLVEEMLDNLVEYGYMTSGTFRDALSKGDLKLRDVSGKELLFSDQFLLADRRLTIPLDGVYRPAPLYLRWSQRLSSLAFGTGGGRFLTLHLVLPFGGAFLLVEGVRHVIAMLSGESHLEKMVQEPAGIEQPTSVKPLGEIYADGQSWIFSSAVWVLVSGLLIYLLMHRPEFRATCGRYWHWAMQWARRILIDWPARLLRIRLIEQLLYSPTYAPLRTYLIKPGLLTAAVLFAAKSFFPSIDFRNALEIFLALALLLNSSIGRYADEWITDQVLRTVEDLRARVFGALFQWIMEIFQQLLTGLDRIVHTLDEWSRFRTRDNQWVKVGKFVSGTLWAVIAYFVVLVSTLLIEPQINPIKHFPVVTVSHKLLLPLGPFFVVWLSPFIGKTQATTLVWSTIWLIPGVFGFLVWELRGNWRLYAANRPTTLQPQSLGSHGETMVALLRKSFHSGTLPKLFTRLRRALRRARDTGDKKQLVRQQTSLRVARHQVQHFVERELLELLVHSETIHRKLLSVKSVRLATNRVQVAVAHTEIPDALMWISWEELEHQLVASVADVGLSATLLPAQRERLTLALAGLLQRTGVEQVKGNGGPAIEHPITWSNWVSWWNHR